ncbi:MBL fold metallo-hydrolase [Haloactinomyces albus]|uniref:Ribonuclease BN (tRNA processing enzyme) n=1 Tax=Haloactinomyces albus TaxID=1352928 RepID=A0AAE4CQR0_9ACTN|nr:MBL fold metallo-hydrolase [Haloactinomyces albus]MDR7304347.1 ribonuclease BN (tRNA processing enzyme) [Haloactinomyces albus]
MNERPISPSMSRRSLFATGAAVAGAAAVSAPAQAVTPSDSAARRHRTQAVLLGTAGGPLWWDGTERAGISSAVVVGDATYLVDCGEGAGRQFARAGLDDLRAVFLTHLHSDHIVDYGNLLVHGWVNKLSSPENPVDIHGPGPRGELPPVAGDAPAPPLVSPDNPEPGTVGTTERIFTAFAPDINDRMRDTLAPDPRSLWTPHDIALPTGLGVDPNDNPHPSMAPFTVFEDDRVRVSATLVRHAPMFPSFAFRFDTDDGSVVFSGDTGVSDNLIRLAHRTDVLVHEVIDPAWIRSRYGGDNPTPEQQARARHHLNAHTSIEEAGAGTLVLNHYVPGDIPPQRLTPARKDFSGRFIAGDDLDRIGVGHPSPR